MNEALIAGDTVLFMYDRVTDLQLGQVAQPVVERRAPLRGVPAAKVVRDPFADLKDDLPWEEPQGGKP